MAYDPMVHGIRPFRPWYCMLFDAGLNLGKNTCRQRPVHTCPKKNVIKMEGLSERMKVLSIMSANTIIVRHMRDRAGMSGTVIGMKRH